MKKKRRKGNPGTQRPRGKGFGPHSTPATFHDPDAPPSKRAPRLARPTNSRGHGPRGATNEVANIDGDACCECKTRPGFLYRFERGKTQILLCWPCQAKIPKRTKRSWGADALDHRVGGSFEMGKKK